MTTKPLARFWKALDEIPEATTDRREWSIRLGEEWPAAAAYLTASGRLAKEIDCPSPGGDGCPRKIVKHTDGRIRAVCGNKPAECDPVDVTREEITCLALDRKKLAAAVGAMLNATSESGARESGAVTVVGSHGVAAGVDIPIVLMVPGPMASVSPDMLASLDVGDRAAAIIAPTPNSIPKRLKAALQARGNAVVALSEISVVDEKCRLVGIQPAETLLSELRDKLLAGPLTASSRAWLLPADARWEELAFEFTSADVVNVRFRGQTKRFEPEHFSMKDRRSGKPTEQWALLKIFAACEGKLGWSDSGAKVTVKKRKQELIWKLRAAFGIDGDAVVWNRGARVYETLFSIRGDVLDRALRSRRG